MEVRGINGFRVAGLITYLDEFSERQTELSC
jgi:hypothetical protein